MSFFQQILNYFVYNCIIKVRNSMELLVWVMKKRSALWYSTSILPVKDAYFENKLKEIFYNALPLAQSLQHHFSYFWSSENC